MGRRHQFESGLNLPVPPGQPDAFASFRLPVMPGDNLLAGGNGNAAMNQALASGDPITNLNRAGGDYFNKGDYQTAEQVWQKAWELEQRQSFGPGSPWALRAGETLLNLGRVCNKLHQYDQADIYNQKAIEQLRSAGFAAGPILVAGLVGIAREYLERRDVEKAGKTYKQALSEVDKEIDKKTVDPVEARREKAYVLRDYAQFLAFTGKKGEAESKFREADSNEKKANELMQQRFQQYLKTGGRIPPQYYNQPVTYPQPLAAPMYPRPMDSRLMPGSGIPPVIPGIPNGSGPEYIGPQPIATPGVIPIGFPPVIPGSPPGIIPIIPGAPSGRLDFPAGTIPVIPGVPRGKWNRQADATSGVIPIIPGAPNGGLDFAGTIPVVPDVPGGSGAIPIIPGVPSGRWNRQADAHSAPRKVDDQTQISVVGDSSNQDKKQHSDDDQPGAYKPMVPNFWGQDNFSDPSF